MSICLFLDYKSIDCLSLLFLLQVAGLLLSVFHGHSGSRDSSYEGVNVGDHGKPQGHIHSSHCFCMSHRGPSASHLLASIKGVRKQQCVFFFFFFYHRYSLLQKIFLPPPCTPNYNPSNPHHPFITTAFGLMLHFCKTHIVYTVMSMLMILPLRCSEYILFCTYHFCTYHK